MALIVEDGTGLATAESYISTADVTTYLTSEGRETDWSALSETQREQALRKATRFLDTKYRGRWKGVKGEQTQALAWPRIGAEDEEGYAVDTDAVPLVVQHACAEAASRSLTVDLLPDVTDAGEVKVEKVKIGPLAFETEYLGGRDINTDFQVIDGLLYGLILGRGGRIMRG